jgi:hypothetical protein
MWLKLTHREEKKKAEKIRRKVGLSYSRERKKNETFERERKFQRGEKKIGEKEGKHEDWRREMEERSLARKKKKKGG